MSEYFRINDKIVGLMSPMLKLSKNKFNLASVGFNMCFDVSPSPVVVGVTVLCEDAVVYEADIISSCFLFNPSAEVKSVSLIL